MESSINPNIASPPLKANGNPESKLQSPVNNVKSPSGHKIQSPGQHTNGSRLTSPVQSITNPTESRSLISPSLSQGKIATPLELINTLSQTKITSPGQISSSHSHTKLVNPSLSFLDANGVKSTTGPSNTISTRVLSPVQYLSHSIIDRKPDSPIQSLSNEMNDTKINSPSLPVQNTFKSANLKASSPVPKQQSPRNPTTHQVAMTSPQRMPGTAMNERMPSISPKMDPLPVLTEQSFVRSDYRNSGDPIDQSNFNPDFTKAQVETKPDAYQYEQPVLQSNDLFDNLQQDYHNQNQVGNQTLGNATEQQHIEGQYYDRQQQDYPVQHETQQQDSQDYYNNEQIYDEFGMQQQYPNADLNNPNENQQNIGQQPPLENQYSNESMQYSQDQYQQYPEQTPFESQYSYENMQYSQDQYNQHQYAENNQTSNSQENIQEQVTQQDVQYSNQEILGQHYDHSNEQQYYQQEYSQEFTDEFGKYSQQQDYSETQGYEQTQQIYEQYDSNGQLQETSVQDQQYYEQYDLNGQVQDSYYGSQVDVTQNFAYDHQQSYEQNYESTQTYGANSNQEQTYDQDYNAEQNQNFDGEQQQYDQNYGEQQNYDQNYEGEQQHYAQNYEGEQQHYDQNYEQQEYQSYEPEQQYEENLQLMHNQSVSHTLIEHQAESKICHTCNLEYAMHMNFCGGCGSRLVLKQPILPPEPVILTSPVNLPVMNQSKSPVNRNQRSNEMSRPTFCASFGPNGILVYTSAIKQTIFHTNNTGLPQAKVKSFPGPIKFIKIKDIIKPQVLQECEKLLELGPLFGEAKPTVARIIQIIDSMKLQYANKSDLQILLEYVKILAQK